MFRERDVASGLLRTAPPAPGRATVRFTVEVTAAHGLFGYCAPLRRKPSGSAKGQYLHELFGLRFHLEHKTCCTWSSDGAEMHMENVCCWVLIQLCFHSDVRGVIVEKVGECLPLLIALWSRKVCC